MGSWKQIFALKRCFLLGLCIRNYENRSVLSRKTTAYISCHITDMWKITIHIVMYWIGVHHGLQDQGWLKIDYLPPDVCIKVVLFICNTSVPEYCFDLLSSELWSHSKDSTYIMPKLWNSLSFEIKSSKSIPTLKSKLKKIQLTT